MKKKLNVVSAVLQTIVLLLFVLFPYATYTVPFNVRITNPDLVFLHTDNGALNFTDMFSNGNINICAVLGVAFLLWGIAQCIVSSIQNDGERDGIAHLLVPVLSSGNIILGVSVLIDSVESVVRFDDYMSPTLKCILILLAATLVTNLIKRSKLIVPSARQKKAAVVPKETGSADELEKYKALLDKGVISQEEYEAKKKQLLGL